MYPENRKTSSVGGGPRGPLSSAPGSAQDNLTGQPSDASDAQF